MKVYRGNTVLLRLSDMEKNMLLSIASSLEINQSEFLRAAIRRKYNQIQEEKSEEA